MIGWEEVFPTRYGTSMFADDFKGVSSIDKDVLCMTKFAPEIVKVLLVREIDFEFVVRIRYCNLLVLQKAPIGAVIRFRTT